jgi:hypothetical protein
MGFASLNEVREGDLQQSSGTLIWVAKLLLGGPRFGESQIRRRSPSPEFYIPRSKRSKHKPKSAALHDSPEETCTPHGLEQIDSNESAIPPPPCENQLTNALAPEDVVDPPRTIPNEDHDVEYHALDPDPSYLWAEEEADFDWYNDFERYEPTLDLHMFPDHGDDDKHTRNLVFEEFTPVEPISPVTIPGQPGSGRKGKGKSSEEYSANAAKFGYKGSYSQYPTHANVGRANGRANGDDPSDGKNSSGSGNEGGGGGGGGGDGGDEEVNDEQVTMASQPAPDITPQERAIPQPPPLRYGESRKSLGNSKLFGWSCVSFLTLLAVFIN